jgi:hypothetical protein
MPSKAETAAVQKIAKAIGKGYVLTAAQPSGAYDRLAPKDGRTVAWVMPRGTYVRVMYVADVTGAPKALLKNTVVTKGRVYLKVTEDNIEQGRELVAYAVKHDPPKVDKPKAEKPKPTPRTTSRRPLRSSRSSRKPAVKKRVHFRLPTGDVRTEKVNEAEVEEFVKSLEGQGATEIRVG